MLRLLSTSRKGPPPGRPTLLHHHHLLAPYFPLASFSSSPKKKALRAATLATTLASSSHSHSHPPTRLPPRLHGFTLRPITVALCGLPNVGKSSLFNRLVKSRLAIVNAMPGTTRDWKESPGSLGALSLTVLDTGGLEGAILPPSPSHRGKTVESRMLEHTERAISHADVVLFMVDGRRGISEEDERFVRWVKQRRPQRGVHLVANKTEGLTPGGEGVEALIKQCYRLGLGEPTLISAEHGEGLGGLYNVLEPHALVPKEEGWERAEVQGAVEGGEDLDAAAEAAEMAAAGGGAAGGVPPSASTLSPRVQARLSRTAGGEVAVAVVGRPNVGKSTLVNALMGRERCLTGPTPGLTRDSVTGWIPRELWGGVLGEEQRVRLVDTAGMRRSGAMDLTTPLEGLAVGQSKRAMALAHIVVLVGDGSGGTAEGLTEEAQTFGVDGGEGGGGGGGGWGGSGGGGSGGGGGGKGDPKTALAREAERVAGEALAITRRLERQQPQTSSPSSSNPPARASRASQQGLTGRPYGLTKADLAIASQVLAEGRGLVVALNKVDAAGGEGVAGEVAKIVRGQLDGLGEGRGAALVPTCALRGLGVQALLKAIVTTHASWCSRASTGKLNAWVSLVMRHHPPPTINVTRKGRGGGKGGKGGEGEFYASPIPLRIKYLAQVNSRPPTFAAFVNHPPARVPTSYKNFLVNSLREEFGLDGVPVRLLLRKRDNPFTALKGGSVLGGGSPRGSSIGLKRASSSPFGGRRKVGLGRGRAGEGGKRGDKGEKAQAQPVSKSASPLSSSTTTSSATTTKTSRGKGRSSSGPRRGARDDAAAADSKGASKTPMRKKKARM